MFEGHCHCGQVHYTVTAHEPQVTICNCTVCRRYGVLWAYGYQDAGITLSGETRVYTRGDRALGFHFCPTCGCVACWRAMAPDPQGRHRIAVNVRLAPPEAVAHLPIRRFDGLGAFAGRPDTGRCVADYWA